MPNGYSVDPNLTIDESQNLKLVTERIASTLTTLERAASTYTQMNAGQAIESYTGAQLEWNQGVNMMREAMGLKSDALNRITENYIDTDQMGRNIFQH